MMSTALLWLPKPCGKGVGAEADAVACIFSWQFGEYPPCCRILCEELSDGHIFCFFCIFMTLPEVAFSQAIFFILVKEEIL